jgi:Zn finger protein HypA/HybF involved in hydrogenase expression
LTPGPATFNLQLIVHRSALGLATTSGIIMAEGYCVRCKAKKPIAEAVEETMKNGRKAVKGKCPTCGAVMFKILGGKAVSTTPVPVPTPAPESPPAS